jgi:molybdopterin-guanine dinucleotide biosynthesis protein A
MDPGRSQLPPGSAPPLCGLVLAGGYGTRLGRDKGEIEYHGKAQARWAVELLHSVVAPVFVSLRAEQRDRKAYVGLPSIVDDQRSEGPASGLLAAWRVHRDVAWLVIAADMPLLTRSLLRDLVDRRDSTALATAYRHADTTPEPLCAVWEPAARPVLERAPAGQTPSLRRVLETGPALLLIPQDPSQLASVNAPDDDAAVRRRLYVKR